MEPADDLIIVDREELEDPAIDEALLRQRTAGPSALQPVEEDRWRRILYSNWICLAFAGASAAFIAWAIIEPHLADTIIFEGRIDRIDARPNAWDARTISVSGTPIVIGTFTSIKSTASGPIELMLEDLHVDSVVKVSAVVPSAEDSEKSPRDKVPTLVAAGILLQPPDMPVPNVLDLQSVLSANHSAWLLLFPWIASMIGLWVGGIEGLICRAAGRAVRGALFGSLAGLAGGFAMSTVAGMAYQHLAPVGNPTSDGASFAIQMLRRGFAWSLLGSAMALGQGLALKNRKLLVNGVVGGSVGGLLGGLLFDPIALLLQSEDAFRGAALSRAIGFSAIGLMVGLLIGTTDLLTRSAWLRVLAGPLRGKEFSFVQTPVRVGSSPRNEIYLFKDLKIQPVHAIIEKLRDTFELRDAGSATGTFVNSQKVQRARLRDGDRIRIGNSEFLYTTREKRG